MPRVRPADWLPWRWRLFGPILPYDLITSSRRGRWYVLRFLLTGLMLFVLWQAWQTALRFEEFIGGTGSRQAAKARFAQGFYASFASVHLTAALLLSTAFLGGAIADERRRRLLDFMFATDLTNREIILGKFASRAFMIGTLLAGSLPILACTMLFGGVPVDWIAQLALLTVSTLLCFGGLSVLVSTTVARPRHAVVRAMALTALLVIVPPVFGLIARSWNDRGFRMIAETAAEWLGLLNPYAVLYRQMFGVLATGAGGYGWDHLLDAAAAQSAVGTAALAFAVLKVRRTVVHPPSETTPKKALFKRRRLFRPALGKWPPILWREAFGEPAAKGHGRVGRVIAALSFLILNGAIVAVWLYALSEGGTGRKEAAFVAMGSLATILSIGGLVLVGTRAAGGVTAEREADTWTTLIAGPIDSRNIVTGKVLGSIVGFHQALVPFALCWLLAGLSAPSEALFRGAAMLAVWLLLAFVNANLGFFFSMRSKSTSAAVVKAVITVLFLGGGYMIPLALFMFRGSHEMSLALSQFFLAAFPAFAEWSPSYPHQETTWDAFTSGVVIYAISATLLYVVNRSVFDNLTGRTRARTPPSSLPPTTTAAATTVEASVPN